MHASRRTARDHEEQTIDTGPAEHLDQPLPEAVRQRVVEAAAGVIGALRPDEIPAPLRRVARFEPRRRARLAATLIAAQLEDDGGFRERVADVVRESEPVLSEAVGSGAVPPAADPVTVAALAYLLRPPGWAERIETARRELERSAAAAEEAKVVREVAELREQIAAAKATRSEETEKLRAELRELRAENAELRKRLHEARGKAKREHARAEELDRRLGEERAAASVAAAGAEAELRRLRSRLSHAEAAAESARRAAREGRNVDEARLRVLLDALTDAAKGLRDEIALPPGITRPADSVGGITPSRPGHRTLPGRALADSDPALLDQLLTLPQVHLIIDGYNVTKTGYGDLPLADQRSRLVSGLGVLHAQTKAEVTVVFDGAELNAPVAVQAPRGVRVLFSAPGQTADELIGHLVRAEPSGRAVVVISSDQEVCDSARRADARPAPSALLLRRLGRT
ncbi:NYN domain-containing protein [Actinoallomurus soli]|uniref:NYN domain-containing protein n=1 Tax=Actinoallomurus soli TaxID=2952535 RepID=UPI00209288A4|nr:NYN domain-containing protein [Actinoallomurus soli]MCO5967091.1 NYN domain-containing protein [Actinoallomurus soli]